MRKFDFTLSYAASRAAYSWDDTKEEIMTNPLKKLSGALFGPAGLVGPQRYATDTSQGGTYSRTRWGR